MPQQSQKVGQLERKTQNRVVALFRDRLGYDERDLTAMAREGTI